MSRIIRIFLIMTGLLMVGTVGFTVIEHWTPLNALYMSVITLTTVGYREVQPLSPPGRVFTIAYLLVGMGVFLFEVVQLGELIVRGELGEWMGKRRMDTVLRTMKNHYIICGFGRLGSRVCEELAERKLPFVVVDRSPEVLDVCREAGWPCVIGDATEDKVLIEAGIQRARGLAAVLSTEADNLYAVLSARLLSKDVRLLSRAATEKGAEKLVKAGASQVISLYATGATKMAQLLANPNLDDFMEIISAKGNALDLAEMQVTETTSWAGKPLAESGLRERGIIIVGIRRPGAEEELLLLPGGTDVPQVGDYLIAMGSAGAIGELIEQR